MMRRQTACARYGTGDYLIISKGENDFKGNCFDKYRWSANTYETPEEIFACFRELGVLEKTVKGITAIGAMARYSLGFWKEIAVSALREAGIITRYEVDYLPLRRTVTLNDGSVHDLDDCLDLLKNVSTERKVRLYEPLLILFEDGDIMELYPCASKGLRIGFNTLPKDMQDGLNRCEADIGALFDPFLNGCCISTVEIYSTVETKSFLYNRENETDKRNEYCLCFSPRVYTPDTSKGGWLHIEEIQCGEYEVSIERKTVKCGELAAMSGKSFQTPILEGRHRGGCENVFPAKGKESSYESDSADIISLCYHTPALYWPLLKKYYDPDLPVNEKNPHRYYDFYYWNYFTKDTVVKMVEEVCAELERVRTLPAAEQKELLQCERRGETVEETIARIEEELDFTERFSARLLGMALNTPGYDYICFEGP